MVLRLLGVVLAAVLAVPQYGCSTYADRVSKIRSAFYENDLAGAEQLIQAGLKHGGRDQDVLKLELAMIQLAGGRAHEAEQTLREVRDRWEFLEQTSAAEQATALLTDDQAVAYAGEDYEKVLVRAMLALANLAQGGDDAEAYSLQTIDKQQQIAQQGMQPDGSNPKQNYQQVALAPYIRALLREETHRDYDDVARHRAMVVKWEPTFAAGHEDLQRAVHGRHSAPGHGVLYVFALVGRGPYKEEADEIPTSAALLIADRIISHNASQTLPPTIASIKVPRVRAQVNLVQSVSVGVDGQTVGTTATISDITRMAIAQNEATLDHVVARAVVRRVLKKSAVYGAKEALGIQRGSLESLPFDLAGIVWEAAERADTRCWGLLPDKIQVLRLELPAGWHTLTLSPLTSSGRTISSPAIGRIEVLDGRNVYALAFFPGTRIAGQIVTGP